ncbi:hypothetical protein SAMN05443665_1006126 [Actinomadura meyerae]|jgi:hypothetical protein|uniref:Uncharacterized protein n=1 Tax=Actinomadura meyerae TaxID=240840 RepID=A0A239FQY0_9ACTN|nr:hypothetical protein [Actinomadura meyerae]SNS59038.1 hypothetical protein SAMN05443665_1006126 [Actinomadura meyerae]
MADVTSEVRITGAERPDGLTLRTVGLAARGLPELRAEGLPPYLGDGWARVLGLAAQRLAATGEPPAELAPGVPIRFEPAGDGALAAVPPPGRDAGEWRRDVLLRLFPEARS